VSEISQQVESLLVVEMNAGQMLEDVRLAVAGRTPVEFFGRLGGVVPFPDEVLDEIRRLAAGKFSLLGHPRDRWLERMSQLTSVN
jgi:2-oxoglutarate/2-oxoacid ferredoxin oxidoreductase subunit alpha